MDRLSELQAQVNGANALNSKTSTFLVSDVEIALNQLADQQKRVEELEKELELHIYSAKISIDGLEKLLYVTNDALGEEIKDREKLQADLASRKDYHEKVQQQAAEIASLRSTIKDLRGALEKIEGNGFCECVDSTCRACVAREALTKSSEGGG